MRIGADKAVVEGRITVPADAPVAVRAEEAGAELDDGALLISRTVSAEGRSRAHLGGRSVPVGMLSELADELVAVHGQTDQQGLLKLSRQRQALDRYAGDAVAGPLAKYAGAHRRLRAVSAELEEIITRARERAQEADMLRYGLDEIAAVEPRAGEDAELAEEAERLGHAEALASAAAPPTRRSRATRRTPRASTPRRSSRGRTGPWRPCGRTTRRWPPSPTGSGRSGSCWATSRASWRGTPTTWTPTRCGWRRSRSGGPR
ncbi:hypothetical protein GCM10020295_65680 [Streptomyces cinereospinus]